MARNARYLTFRSAIALAATLPAALLVAPCLPVEAHEETFAWTYPPVTPDRGERELELKDDWGAGSGYHKLQAELEYGVTEWFSLAPYLVFARDNGSDSLKLDAVKLEARYLLDEPGSWPVDVGLYLEGEHPFGAGDPNALEGKILLERDLGPWTLGWNGVATALLASPNYVNWGWTAGLGYSLTRNWNVNLEALGGAAATDLDVDPTNPRAAGAYVGPSVAGFFGPLHVNLAIAAGVTPGAEPVLARGQVSHEF